mmetsp:Transcript_73422/g.219179  ORF Transcript_73422/g.219179 Transcript_73422/m.219179 type:complete len:418 (-) Transcript_73422:43-1296(-)
MRPSLPPSERDARAPPRQPLRSAGEQPHGARDLRESQLLRHELRRPALHVHLVLVRTGFQKPQCRGLVAPADSVEQRRPPLQVRQVQFRVLLGEGRHKAQAAVFASPGDGRPLHAVLGVDLGLVVQQQPQHLGVLQADGVVERSGARLVRHGHHGHDSLLTEHLPGELKVPLEYRQDQHGLVVVCDCQRICVPVQETTESLRPSAAAGVVQGGPLAVIAEGNVSLSVQQLLHDHQRVLRRCRTGKHQWRDAPSIGCVDPGACVQGMNGALQVSCCGTFPQLVLRGAGKHSLPGLPPAASDQLVKGVSHLVLLHLALASASHTPPTRVLCPRPGNPKQRAAHCAEAPPQCRLCVGCLWSGASHRGTPFEDNLGAHPREVGCSLPPQLHLAEAATCLRAARATAPLAALVALYAVEGEG